MDPAKDEPAQNRKPPKVIRFMLPVIIVAVLAFGIFLFLKIDEYNLQKKEQKSREFLEQIIESVNNQTDFYKKRASALNVRQIEIYKDKFSNDYEIDLIDSDPGHYEYKITFNGKNEFLIIVLITKDGGWYSHVHFRNTAINW